MTIAFLPCPTSIYEESWCQPLVLLPSAHRLFFRMSELWFIRARLAEEDFRFGTECTPQVMILTSRADTKFKGRRAAFMSGMLVSRS